MKLCFDILQSLRYCARRIEVRNGVEHLRWRQRSQNWVLAKLQIVTAQCASIGFQLFLHRWVPFTSYYNLHHWSFTAYVVVINWAAGAAIASAQCSVRGGAERCRAPQLVCKVHEIELAKTSTKHSSMRTGRIWTIVASLDSAQFIV